MMAQIYERSIVKCTSSNKDTKNKGTAFVSTCLFFRSTQRTAPVRFLSNAIVFEMRFFSVETLLYFRTDVVHLYAMLICNLFIFNKLETYL